MHFILWEVSQVVAIHPSQNNSWASCLAAQSDGGVGEGLPLPFKALPLTTELRPLSLKPTPLLQEVGVSQVRGHRWEQAILETGEDKRHRRLRVSLVFAWGVLVSALGEPHTCSSCCCSFTKFWVSSSSSSSWANVNLSWSVPTVEWPLHRGKKAPTYILIIKFGSGTFICDNILEHNTNKTQTFGFRRRNKKYHAGWLKST